MGQRLKLLRAAREPTKYLSVRYFALWRSHCVVAVIARALGARKLCRLTAATLHSRAELFSVRSAVCVAGILALLNPVHFAGSLDQTAQAADEAIPLRFASVVDSRSGFPAQFNRVALIRSAQANGSREPVQRGLWGGPHISLTVTETGGRVEHDCAFGTIDEPLIADEDGNFEARGTHVFERGGPRESDEPAAKQHAARYHGWTDGDEIRLTVTLPDLDRELGPFLLRLEQPPQLEKCL